MKKVFYKINSCLAGYEDLSSPQNLEQVSLLQWEKVSAKLTDEVYYSKNSVSKQRTEPVSLPCAKGGAE